MASNLSLTCDCVARRGVARDRTADLHIRVFNSNYARRRPWYTRCIEGVSRVSTFFYQNKLTDFCIITRPVPGRVQGERCTRSSACQERFATRKMEQVGKAIVYKKYKSFMSSSVSVCIYHKRMKRAVLPDIYTKKEYM